MTDSRTNEPTGAQVEAAAKAIREVDGRSALIADVDLPEHRARAALVAAAGVAPPAPSGHDWMTWEESGKNGTYCRNCGIWAGKSGGVACAPVQPSSTVDEITDAIWARATLKTSLGFSINSRDGAAVLARAVVEAIGGEGRGE